MNNTLLQSQIGSPDFTSRAYYKGESGLNAIGSTPILVDSKSVSLLSGGTYAQGYGGAGSAKNPFWLSGTRDMGTTKLVKKDSYVLGSGMVRSDMTYTNNSSAAVSAQMGYWVDSYFAGNDSGTTLMSGSAVSSLNSGTTAASSFVSASPGAKFVGGYYNSAKAAAQRYNGMNGQCYNSGGVQQACSNEVDNGMAIGWVVNVPAGESVTRTFFATFSPELKFADISADAAVSKNTVSVGESFDYTLSVANNGGPATADGVTVDFPLPAGVTLKSQSGTGSYDAATGAWSVGDVPFGQDAKITLTVDAQSVGLKQAQILRAEPLVALDITPFDPATAQVLDVTVADAIDASNSTIAAVPTSVEADGVAASTVTVTTFGKTGDQMSIGGADVKVLSTLGTVSEVVDNNDGTYTATVTSTKTGPAVISATVDGENLTGPTVTFTPGAPTTSGEDSSTVSVSSDERLADGATAHTVTVTLKDANGNFIPKAATRLTATADPDAGVAIGTFTEESTGVYTAPITSTSSGEKTITAFADATVNLGSGTAMFIAGEAVVENSALTLSTGDKVADGTDAHSAQVLVKDAYGNPVPGTAVTFTVDGDATGSGIVETDANGTAPIAIRSTLAGLKAVSATIGGSAVSGAGDVNFIAGAVESINSVFSVSPGPVLADGTATHTATVIAKDAKGNPVKNVAVEFVVPADVTATSPAVTDSSGATTVKLTSVKSGTYEIGATIDSDAVANSPQNVTFSAGAPVATESSWTLTPAGPVAADGSSAYTAVLTARDTNGNAVPNAEFSVDVSGAVTPSRVDWVTGADGTVTGTFTSVKAGTYPATVSLGGDTAGGSKDLVFNAGTVSSTVSSIAADPDRIKANGSTESTVTVTLKDANGNVLDWVPSPAVVISTDEGQVSDTVDNGDGTYTATLTASAAGTATLSFTIDGKPANDTTQVTLVNAIAPVAPLVNATNGTSVTGSAQPNSTVTVKNANGVTIGTGLAGTDGSFDFALAPRPAEGTVISVTATDADDNVSAPTLITIDSIAPDAPTVDATNGTKVSGQAEADSKVIVRDKNGTILGSGTA
ncbi:invasin domain 3-containing protein, partial [Leucobacter luti]|uniref:invasin domain 3-containing protein n=1 Tax=Leucobacter luti TaxID=340320 RepID=UPI00102B6355